MTFFVVYDPATGAIRRTGFCSRAADMALQARAGEAVIEAAAHHLSNASAVDITRSPPAIVATA